MSVLDDLKRAQNFTDTERSIAQYVLQNVEDVVHMNIAALAEKTHTSNAAIIRLSRKLGLSGFREFRVQLASDIEKWRVLRRRVNVNLPVDEEESVASMMSNIAELHREAVEACYATVAPRDVAQIAAYIRKASHVYLYASGDSQITCMAFANMLSKIGIVAIIANQFDEGRATAYTTHPGDVVFFISYRGRALRHSVQQEVVQTVRAQGCRTVLITAARKTSNADVFIPLPPLERETEVIGTFFSQACIKYVLNCIYSAVFVADYQDSVKYKRRIDGSDFASIEQLNG